MLFCVQIVCAQEGFHFETNKNKISIPFQFINNLIIIPIEVNGVSMSFLLDTGVEDSILFSLDETDEVRFSQVEKIKIKGLGSNNSFEGFKSNHNKLSINNYTDLNHAIYLVLDQNINISAQVGFPVNGIIGYHFFENNLVKINYTNKKITVYNTASKALKSIKKDFVEQPIELIQNKPYITCQAYFEDEQKPVATKLLLDTGNSDALWFFKQSDDKIVIPKSNIDDYLGRGFSGDVFGKRGKIKALQINNFKFSNPLASFPDTLSTTNVDKNIGRGGSIGSDIIRRFTIVLDYKSNRVYLKKNSQFDDPFNINMSGIEIQHKGLQWISEGYEENPTINNNFYNSNGDKMANNFKYKFELKPIYVITSIRKNSPGDSAGLQKEDVIVKIDGKNGYNFSLQQINELLKSEEGKIVEFEIDRKGKIMKFKIQLKDVLE